MHISPTVLNIDGDAQRRPTLQLEHEKETN